MPSSTSVNEGLANFETIKRFHLVPDEWSMDSGEFTPTMKLKRGGGRRALCRRDCRLLPRRSYRPTVACSI